MKALSGKNEIDALLLVNNFVSNPVLTWQTTNTLGQPVNLDFGFLNTGANGVSSFVPMNSNLQSATRSVLSQFSEVANITFNETSPGSADINFGTGALAVNGYSFTAGITYFGWNNSSDASYSWLTGANVYLTTAGIAGYSTAAPGDEAYETLVHEVGHALGLGHPHDDIQLSSTYDSNKYTVMSYNSYYSGASPAGLMLLDIQALQYLYGANTSYKSGNTSINLKEFVQNGPRALWDGGGTDTLDMSSLSKGETLSLIEGKYSSIFAKDDFVIAYGAKIENAKGTNFNDHIYGTATKNKLWGQNGNDSLVGYGGNDSLYGGSGDDTLKGGDGNDYVLVGGGKEYFDGGAGNDYISYFNSGGITLDLRANTVSGSWAGNDTIKSFESASGSGTGDDKIYGTDGANTIRTYGGNDKVYSRAGNDKIYAGDGNDRLEGGSGTDALYGGAGADVFHFNKGDGNDTIKDFQNNVDRIEFDNFSLAAGKDLMDYAKDVGDDIVFDMGGGNILTVENAEMWMMGNDIFQV